MTKDLYCEHGSEKDWAVAVNRHELGQAGENAAATHLSGKGFRILARNWRKGSLELDIICEVHENFAQKILGHKTLVFVEVRTRTIYGKLTPAESFTPRKARSFLRAVRAWLAETGRWESPCRCDLVSVIAAGEPPSFSVEHTPNVIEFDSLTSARGGNTPWQPW